MQTSILFSLTTLVTVFLFFLAARKSWGVLVILAGWLLLQGIVASTGFYTTTDSMPPRLLLAVVPALVCILILFLTTKDRSFLDQLDLRYLTLLHTVRIPVEIMLFMLFMNGAVPEVMTFEGRNFDILSGITAPVIFYIAIYRSGYKPMVLLVWNFICLGLLFNIVTTAVLAAPFPFQQIAFDQPNVAVLHFPYNWLPACVVPIVLLSHLAAFRQLLRKNFR